MQDLPHVAAIEAQVQTYPWTQAQFADSVAQHHCQVLVDSQQQVQGFCILQPVLDEANLLLMAIAPQHHGKRLGQLLLENAVEQLGERCRMVFLEVRASNSAAQRLYERCGFNVLDTRRNYYPVQGGGREDAVLMALTRFFA